jgi:hypothetical protein
MKNTTADQTFTTVKTRTGKFAHTVYMMQNTTLCGTFLRFRASQMQVEGPATCEKCLASQANTEAW